MESKKIIAAALAATIAASVSPINVMGDNEIENFGLGYSEDDNNDDLMLMSAENIDVRKISETDTSITVSWSGFNTEKAAAYTVVCDGLESEKITDTTYTVVGLTGGCEYSITVRAYDEAGEIVGVSDAIYAYTDWNIISDVTLFLPVSFASYTALSAFLNSASNTALALSGVKGTSGRIS